jgi:hypothetical protein
MKRLLVGYTGGVHLSHATGAVLLEHSIAYRLAEVLGRHVRLARRAGA